MPFKLEDLEQKNLKPKSSDGNAQELTADQIKQIAINAVRFGTWLYHQGLTQDQSHQMATSLWKRNFPDEEMPEDIRSTLDQYTDSHTNKTFADIIHESLIKDWGMSDATQIGCIILEQMHRSMGSIEFVNYVQEHVNDMADDFNDGFRQFRMAHEMGISKAIN